MNSQTEEKLRALVARTNDFELISNMFDILSDANRMRLFWTLCHCEECVAGLASMMNMSSPAISHHLRSLKSSGLIESTRRGKEVFYRATRSNTTETLHKSIENLLESYCPQASEYTIQESINKNINIHAEQAKCIKEVHQFITDHLSERITIEELAHRFHINTTSLKSAFKRIYGNSIAAHTKEHRMEKAQELIKEDKMNLREVAKAVGYDSQSKFTAAFKDFYGVAPSEYRKQHH